jgi:hypothetical protein
MLFPWPANAVGQEENSMADPKPAETLSNADLLKSISQIAEALKPKTPLEHAGLSPDQIKQVTEPPTWIPRYRYIPCKSEETGATFDAHVLESRDAKLYPQGRIVNLRNYKHPEGTETYQSNGGLVPDGLQILVHGAGPGTYTDTYKQWRWTTFYQTDLRRYVQRAIAAHLCSPDGDGLKTPWLAGAVRALEYDSDAA